MSRRSWLWLATLLAAGPWVESALGDVPGRGGSSASLKKRADVEVVQAVVIGAVRYEAPVDGKVRGLGQNGGYIVARDKRSGARLWALKVYAIRYAANMEADKQDVFITRIKASPDCKALLLTDERGRHWRVDLRTRTAAPD